MVSTSLTMTILALALAAEPLELPDREEVLSVPPELRQQLHESRQGVGTAPRQQVEWLSRFLFASDGLHLQYGHDRTGTVAETWGSRRANCLSATVMFLVLADELGLDAVAQEYSRVLIWNRQDDTVYRIAHVNVRVRTPAAQFVLDFEPDLITEDDHRPRRISEDRLLAHFYNNRAAELMTEHNFLAALMAIHRALKIDDSFVPAWNNLGVLNHRLERYDSAEAAFQQALSLHGTSESVLSNLAALYEDQGQTDLLQQYESRLERARRRDPFHQFEAGLAHEEAGELRQARRHFRRAVALHHHEPRFHFALARTHHALGADWRAAWALRRAINQSEGDQQSLYEQKLSALQDGR